MKVLGPLFRTAFFVIVLDQLTKLLVVHVMALKEVAVIPVYHPYLMFRMAWNEGINFGIPLANKWGLIALALVICLWIIIWMIRDKPGRWAQVSAGLVVGGAIGNIIDRVAYGAVADFLNMSCCGWENPWSFNVADIAIFFGALGLIFMSSPSGEPKAESE